MSEVLVASVLGCGALAGYGGEFSLEAPLAGRRSQFILLLMVEARIPQSYLWQLCGQLVTVFLPHSPCALVCAQLLILDFDPCL